MRTLFRLAVGCVAAALIVASAPAQDVQELTGTLKKIKTSGSVAIGYREASAPFSYRNPRGRPIGYSIDLCKAIVEEVKNELDTETIGTTFVPVTPQNHIPLLVEGAIDLECGTTTNNRERRKVVAFSPITFVSGTKLLVKTSAPIQSYKDLANKTVAVAAGTTNEAALKGLSDKERLNIALIGTKDIAEAFALLKAGQADAFASDEVLLMDLLAKNPRTFKVVGDYLSYDPYGIMYRKDDPAFAAVVGRAFSRLMTSRDILDIYDKWFLRRLPSGETLDLHMSAQLQSIFEDLGLPE